MPLNYIIKVMKSQTYLIYIVLFDVKIINCSNVQVIIVLMNTYLVDNNIHKIPQKYWYICA